MQLMTPGYRGRHVWCVSLDGQPPVEVKAPTDADALIRAALYYRVDWLRAENRLRFKVWRFKDT